MQRRNGRREAPDRKRVVIRNADGVWNIYFGPLKLDPIHERYLHVEDEYGRPTCHKV